MSLSMPQQTCSSFAVVVWRNLHTCTKSLANGRHNGCFMVQLGNLDYRFCTSLHKRILHFRTQEALNVLNQSFTSVLLKKKGSTAFH